MKVENEIQKFVTENDAHWMSLELESVIDTSRSTFRILTWDKVKVLEYTDVMCVNWTYVNTMTQM